MNEFNQNNWLISAFRVLCLLPNVSEKNPEKQKQRHEEKRKKGFLKVWTGRYSCGGVRTGINHCVASLVQKNSSNFNNFNGTLPCSPISGYG